MTFKKFTIILGCVLLAALLILLLIPHRELSGTVTFYYARKDFIYGMPDGAIGSELRQVTGHENDLDYLLTLYLEGPLDDSLRSPFPASRQVRLLGLEQIGDALHIRISDLTSAMSDSEFSLAAACLTRTCLGIHNVQAVQVESGDRSRRMNPANLQLYDESTSVVHTEREEEK